MIHTQVKSQWERPLDVKLINRSLSAQKIREILLPSMETIPSVFKEYSGKEACWCRAIDDFFFHGATKLRIIGNNGITQQQIVGHLREILPNRSYQHEHKVAGCAWLLSLWVVTMTYQTKVDHMTHRVRVSSENGYECA